MATLLLLKGPGAGKHFSLDACPLTIGRHVAAAVRLDLPAVSRQHARVTFERGRYFLEDLGSSNGTVLNGTLLAQKAELHSQDRFVIGPCEFLFEEPSASEAGLVIHSELSATSTS